MNLLDFFTGFTLMNAMPHFVLGIWKAKMLSGFGSGNKQNVAWAFLNFAISIALFLYQYDFRGFVDHAMYSGALLVLLTFFCTSRLWVKHYYGKEK